MADEHHGEVLDEYSNELRTRQSEQSLYGSSQFLNNRETHEITNRLSTVSRPININNKFFNKKCWICLSLLEFDYDDQLKIQKFFFEQNLLLLNKTSIASATISNNERNSNNKNDKIKLRLFKDKIVLSACKCRKKLAHKTCFNNYIDLKQNGNVKIEINCSKCNYTYEFDYQYNSLFLKCVDLIEVSINTGSYLLTAFIFVLSVYWCCVSYSAATIIQMYGYHESMDMFNNASFITKLFLPVVMPLMPLALISARYLSWEKYFIQLLPNYFNFAKPYFASRPKINQENDSNTGVDFSCISSLRLIIGGLFLPTASIAIDKLVLSKFIPHYSQLFRTAMAGLAFVSIKGILKIVYFCKKRWQKSNREILNSNY